MYDPLNNWKIKVRGSDFRLGYDVFIFRKVHGDSVEILRGDIVKTYKEGEDVGSQPSMYLEPDIAQGLVDALSESGIKPQKGFIEGKLEGTENHLKDLRKLLKL